MPANIDVSQIKTYPRGTAMPIRPAASMTRYVKTDILTEYNVSITIYRELLYTYEWKQIRK
jgi:hypothetical protein